MSAPLNTDPHEQITPPALWEWRRQLSWSNQESIRAVFIGSSTTWGRDADSQEYSYVAQLGRKLRGGDRTGGEWSGGCHYSAQTKGWEFSAGVTNVNEGLSLWSKRLAAGAWMERVVNTCDGVEVMHAAGAGQGRYKITVDGGAVVRTVDPGPSSETSHGETSPQVTFTRGQHRIRITAMEPVTISGVYAHDGDQWRGLRVYNAGLSGATAAHYTLHSPQGERPVRTHCRAIGALNPSLVGIMIGANNYTVGTPTPVYEADVREQINLVRASCDRRPSVLLIQSYAKQDVNADTAAVKWDEYGDALARIAADTPDVDYLDLSAQYPVSQRYDFHDMLTKDSAHSSNRGHAWIAETIAEHLRSRVSAASAPVSLLGPVNVAHPSTLDGVISAWRASDLDPGKVSSWYPYAGERTAPLLAPNSGAQPTVLEHGPGDRRFVRFGLPNPGNSLNHLMQTGPGPWEKTYQNGLTIIAVVKLYQSGEPCRNGNLFSGKDNKFIYAGGFGDNTLRVGAGGTEEPHVAGPYFGHGRWKVVAIRYEGANSALWTDDMPVQRFNLTHGGDYGLNGVTLSGNRAGNANSISMDLAEFLVFWRPLTDTEAEQAVARLARDYGFDRYGRTQVAPAA